MDVRHRLRAYYNEHFSERCCGSTGEPCGPNPLELSSGGSRPASYPAVGELYGTDPKVRRIVFVGMNPNSWGVDRTAAQTKDLFSDWCGDGDLRVACAQRWSRGGPAQAGGVGPTGCG